jgi:cobalt-zinc-cadmium efflux system membrane fusion protein
MLSAIFALCALRQCTIAVLVSLAAIALGPTSPAQAGPGGEGHTHGDETATAVSGTSPRVAMSGELYDVVAILKNGYLTFFVDRVSDNAPVTEAMLEVTLGAATSKAEPHADGTFRMAASAVAPGSQELVVSIQAHGGDDLVAGTLEVPESAIGSHSHSGLDVGSLFQSRFALFASVFLIAAAGTLTFLRRRRKLAVTALIVPLLFVSVQDGLAGPGGEGHTHGDETSAAVSSDAPHRLPDGSVFLPKPTQRLLEVRTLKAQPSEVAKSIVFPGRVIASPNRSGLVQSINGGRVSAPDTGLPQLGQPVKKGQLLAFVEPPVNAADETTISDKFGEINQQIILAETKLQRLIPLAASNAVPKTQVIDLETELESLRKRLVSIRAQRRQPEELRAPIDGTIALSRVVAGQVVVPQDQLFQIVDKDSLWVEGFIFGETEPDSIVSATAISRSNANTKLQLEGVGQALQQQAIQVHFSIANPTSSIRVGEPVRIVALGKDKLNGIVVPREAVVRSPNGELIVWTMAAPERFVPQPVRIEPVDGERVAILAGLQPDQRVVVKAAELINQVK